MIRAIDFLTSEEMLKYGVLGLDEDKIRSILPPRIRRTASIRS